MADLLRAAVLAACGCVLAFGAVLAFGGPRLRHFFDHSLAVLGVAVLIGASGFLLPQVGSIVGWFGVGIGAGLLMVAVWQIRHQPAGLTYEARIALGNLLKPGEESRRALEQSERFAPRLDYSTGIVDSAALSMWEAGPLLEIKAWREECVRVISKYLGYSRVTEFLDPTDTLPIIAMPAYLADGRMSGVWEQVSLQLAWLREQLRGGG